MPKKEINRILGPSMVGIATIVVALNFCLSEISHTWHMVSLFFSFALSVVAALLCFYAIGFTTIRMSLVATATIALILSVWTDNWPSKLRFNAAKARFEQIAANVREGNEISSPFWVGTYRVKKMKRTKTGEIRFWTALHPYGNTGLVLNAKGRPEVNKFVELELDEHWYLVCVE